MSTQTSLEFYLRHGLWSDPLGFSSAFDAIDHSVPAVTSAVQGLLLHDYFGALFYADPPANSALASRPTLLISERLPAIHEFGETPLTEQRRTSSRTVGTCRDFALLTCSILRHHGIPARVRCGFALYFHPPTYEDHWICQYWDIERQRWKMADAQLDREHKEQLSITFDTNDIPKEQFLYPWQVWKAHGNHLGELEAFGHGDAKGFWFVHINLARDFLSLAKHEVSEWDTWRDHRDSDRCASDEAIAQCNELADAAESLETASRVDIGAFDGLIASLKVPFWKA